MQYLAPIDWFWIVLFTVLMIVTGVAFYRLGIRSEEDFFLAGRRLPWWLPAMSVYATHTATDTPIFVTGVVFLYGVSGLWYVFFPVWVGVSAFISTRIFRRSVAYTIAEWQNLRFSGLGGELLRVWFAGWQFFMSMFVLGWVGAAMGKVCAFLFGWPLWVPIVGLSSLCAIYVLAAGYWGVIVADFQQGIIAFLLIIVVSVWAILAAGGPAVIVSKIEDMNSSYAWTVPESLSSSDNCVLRVEAQDEASPGTGRRVVTSQAFSITDSSAVSVDEEGPTYNQMFEHDGEFRIVFPRAGDILQAGEAYKIIWESPESFRNSRLQFSRDGGRSWITISDQLRNGQSWRLDPFAFSGWFQGDFPLVWFITMLIMALGGGFGIGTNSDWFIEAQRIQSAGTLKEASLVMLGGGVSVLFRNGIWIAAGLGLFTLAPHVGDIAQVETSWYTAGFRYLPVGVVGLLVAGILAIHLSTISSRLNLGAMYATRDLYHHYINPRASEAQLVRVGRISTLILLLGSFVFGLMITEITQWLIFAMWIMFAGVWLPNILQVIWWRFNAWGFLAAWVSSFIFSWLVVWVLPQFQIIPQLPDYLQFWTLFLLGALVFIPFIVLTKPEDMNHLVRFYVMTRPIGWWGPVREEAARLGLLKPLDGKRSWIKRDWTAAEADEWTKEDFLAALIAAIALLTVSLGSIYAMLLEPLGFLLLILTAGLGWLLLWLIGPKINALSAEYEKKQKRYIDELESLMRWEQEHE